ncbi:hypothetical protein EVAR_71039_1 [Eumeta japonica]|uniref:Uncharacterized protein n=1 Tax=Eumeta variegata TaxID=151549 RepID=A0A4C2AAU8_EUMVA|nr:hypothetical protein EVAR_71039_1 [Eumeta japonica]
MKRSVLDSMVRNATNSTKDEDSLWGFYGLAIAYLVKVKIAVVVFFVGSAVYFVYAIYGHTNVPAVNTTKKVQLFWTIHQASPGLLQNLARQVVAQEEQKANAFEECGVVNAECEFIENDQEPEIDATQQQTISEEEISTNSFDEESVTSESSFGK